MNHALIEFENDNSVNVIASFQRIAVANGIGLVAACDLAIASDDAKFRATATNVGLFCMGPAEDAHEGVNAFLDKRKPVWKNR